MLEKCIEERYEFVQRVLARVKEPITKFAPRLQAVIFLGFAPGVASGYFVMRPDGRVELSSTITEDTVFDEPEPMLHENQMPGGTKEEVTEITEDVT